MNKQEIMELMLSRCESIAPEYDGTTCSSTRRSAFYQGHADTADILSECLSLAFQALRYHEGYAFYADGSKMSNEAAQAIAAIESKLKGAK